MKITLKGRHQPQKIMKLWVVGGDKKSNCKIYPLQSYITPKSKIHNLTYDYNFPRMSLIKADERDERHLQSNITNRSSLCIYKHVIRATPLLIRRHSWRIVDTQALEAAKDNLVPVIRRWEMSQGTNHTIESLLTMIIGT